MSDSAAGGGEAASAEPAPLRGMALIIVAAALAMGTFMQVLDTTIANVSLPTIAGNLGVSYDQSTWVITAFAVSNGVTVPLTGWLMGRYGVVKVFIGAVSLFTLASLLCGLAWNMSSLVFFRALQGAVSGPMTPGSQVLLLMIFPTNRKATALAIWSLVTLVAPVMGPLLGGWISDNASWRWIFLINVPIGVTAALICWQGLGHRDTPTRKLPIDVVGLCLLVLWVGALQTALDTGKSADWFASPLIVVELVVSLVGFVAWVIWELTEKHPIVDLSLFKIRSFTFGVIAFCVTYGLFFGASLLQPLWLQTQMGYPATWAGLAAAPAGAMAVIVTPLMARFRKVDTRIYATFSTLTLALSFFMRSNLTPGADFNSIVLCNLVAGVGVGTFFVSMITVYLQDVPSARVPSASGIGNFARITAGSFVASVTTTLWDRRAAVHQSQMADAQASHGPVWDHAVAGLQAAGASYEQAVGSLSGMVANQASILGVFDMFRLAGWIILIITPLIWLTPRPQSSR